MGYNLPNNFAWRIGIMLFVVSLCMFYITPISGVKPPEIESLIVLCTGLLCMAIGDHK